MISRQQWIKNSGEVFPFKISQKTGGIITDKEFYCEVFQQRQLAAQQQARQEAILGRGTESYQVHQQKFHAVLNQIEKPIVNQIEEPVVKQIEQIIISDKQVFKQAVKGTNSWHNTGTTDINYEGLSEIVQNISPGAAEQVRRAATPLNELNFHLIAASPEKISEKEKWCSDLGISTNTTAEQLTVSKAKALKVVTDMRTSHDMDSVPVEQLINDITTGLDPQAYNILTQYLQKTIPAVNPCICSAVVTIYFSLKTGPGPMVIMYYTLCYDIAMHDFLTKITAQILKNNTPIHTVSPNIKQIKNLKYFGNMYENSLKFYERLNVSDYFKNNKTGIVTLTTGICAITFTALGIKYTFLNEIVSDKNTILGALEAAKQYGVPIAYALGNTGASFIRSFQSGILNVAIDAISKDGGKAIEVFKGFREQLKK